MRWLSPAAILFLAAPALVCAATSSDQVLSLDESFVRSLLSLSPSTATAQGYHQDGSRNLDELLDDYSTQGVEAQRRLYKNTLQKTAKLEKSGVSAEDGADLQMVDLQCRLGLLDLDEVQSYRHNPTIYVELIGNAIYSPFILDYAPEEVRFRQITARIEKIPDFLATAKHNLLTSPPIWNQVAREENDGNINLIEQTIGTKVPQDLQGRYRAAATRAIQALRDFNSYLQNDLSKRSSDWRLRAPLYQRKFEYSLATGDTVAKTLHDAEQKLTEIREEMRKQATAIYPKYFRGKPGPADLNQIVGQVLDKIAMEHATPQGYFAEAEKDLRATTEFVATKHLLELPKNNNLKVIPTPEFMRGIYGVGGFSPAPVLEPKLGAFYWITPFSSSMKPEQVESELRENNRYGLEILTMHEAMPGHYVQAEYASRIEPKWRRALRALLGNNPYVEGWAVYATQMMIEQGFNATPEMRLTMSKQMLRVVSNTILDIKMQTMGMSDTEAMDLMIRQTFQEREEAEKKLQRAKLASCQLPTYFVGWGGWNQLRMAQQKKLGSEFRLSEFHERALKEGAVPIPALSKLLQ